MRVPVGLEIGEQYLKIVVGKPQAIKQSGIADCIVEPISSLSDTQIAKLIEDNLRKANIKPSNIVVSMPRNTVTVRNLHLPSQDENEIEQMLQLHIGRIVPYKKEEIIFDNISLGADAMGYAKEIVAIARIDAVQRQAKIIEAAGFFPDQIVLSSYGAWQWTVSSFKNQINSSDIYLLIDLDSAYADFIVFNRDAILFTRSINIELKDGLNAQEAARLVGEMRQSIVIFGNEEGNKNLVKIFVSGSGLCANLHAMIVPEFDIPVEIVPSACAQHSAKVKNQELLSVVSLNAVSQLVLGSNCKMITFTLPEIQARRSIKEKIKELTILGTLLVYILTVILIFFLGSSQSYEMHLKRLSQENKIIEKNMGDLAVKYKNTEFVKSFIRSRKAPLILMAELQKLVMPDIAISMVNIDEQNKVVLRGQGDQMSETFKFINMLEGSKNFKGVTTKYTRTKKVNNREVTDFEINFEIAVNP